MTYKSEVPDHPGNKNERMPNYINPNNEQPKDANANECKQSMPHFYDLTIQPISFINPYLFRPARKMHSK
jgi:hypothetical protein